MNKMHSQLSLNFQEEQVKEVLDACGLVYRPHAVFAVGSRSLVVDFFLHKLEVVIECWISRSRRGVALSWVERNAAYVDLKFARLKQHCPRLKCLGFAQAPQVDLAILVDVVGSVMVHADAMAYTFDELALTLRTIPRRAGSGIVREEFRIG